MEQVKARECQNNLLNISKAVFLYVDDNQNQLMGPVWGSQRPRAVNSKGWRYDHFSYFLQDYMPDFMEMGADGTLYNSAFICRANADLEMQGIQAVHHRSHYRNTIDNIIDGKPIYGRPQFKSNGNYFAAKNTLTIDVIENTSSVEILVDSDLDNTPWLDDKPIYDFAYYPVHEEAYRNNLYFDGSVRVIDWAP